MESLKILKSKELNLNVSIYLSMINLDCLNKQMNSNKKSFVWIMSTKKIINAHDYLAYIN